MIYHFIKTSTAAGMDLITFCIFSHLLKMEIALPSSIFERTADKGST